MGDEDVTPPFDELAALPPSDPDAAPAPDPAGWYLAQLRPNQTERARRNLERQGYGCFLPRRARTRRAGGQLRPGLAPLFPGYLFVSIGALQQWRPVNGTYGVVRLVMRNAHTPQPVPEAVMAELLAGVDAEGVLRPAADLAPGDTVRIEAGPMTGLVARVEGLDAAGRVGVLLEMMGQAVRASLPCDHVQRLAG